MKVCVQGLWHLGTVTAACLASRGNYVVGLDFETATIDGLKRGVPPIFEPGLEELVKEGISNGQLSFTADAEQAVKGVDVLWIAYDTPVDDDDNADVDFVVDQIEKAILYLSDGVTVLISSQMPVGSVKRLELIAKERYPSKGIGFACSPENLRLGRALDVFLNPDRIVVGVRSSNDQERLNRLLQPITDRIEWMSVESAEMTKHAINAFLATSVTFANEIATICELTGADAKQVERGLKSENRIGSKAYLSPGGAFAGGTLARDIAFLNKVGREKHLITPLLSSVKASNDDHKQWVKRKLQSLFPEFPRISLAIWGLTYKPGTDTLRRSLAVELCDWLVAMGVSVCIHDPVIKVLPMVWEGKVKKSDNALSALMGAQVLVISTEWPEYKEILPDQVVEMAPGLTILDANRFLTQLADDARLKYVAVGMPE